ncbi:2-keto-4-pentenoate hydratase [Micromonospora sagamiensis]|uniref:2-keto-4-pentenoate hydratase n=1 Tax=Micromonospora sagamiensis TaxID=47875 RepID=A0A562WIW8_9ACTN|nr:fumarylacetoacetate hydrolase family protein [Micromonospora sagamiensis]TWJ29484.1 2-keto-4-pentenoate hydratase [Micromonospora sagamiensis]BCL17488.1 4-oxalocrotonate decarboxylase [Micromonospora sagamiensis]
MTDAAVRALRDTVRSARADHRPTGGNRFGTVPLADAYRIQADLFGAPAAWKLGLLSPAKQRQMGLTEPIYGRVPAPQLRTGPIRLAEFIQPRFEPELAAVLGADIPVGASPAQAEDAVSHLVLALDILDSAWRDYRFCAAEVIADNSSGGAVVLADEPVDSRTGALRLTLDGTPLAEGDLAGLAPPAPRLAWLAGQVGGLPAGTRVLLGSPAASVPARAGALEVHGGGRTLTIAIEP